MVHETPGVRNALVRIGVWRGQRRAGQAPPLQRLGAVSMDGWARPDWPVGQGVSI